MEKTWKPNKTRQKLGKKKRAQSELSCHQLQTTAVCSLHHVEESCILHCFPADIPAEAVPFLVVLNLDPLSTFPAEAVSEDMTAAGYRHLCIPVGIPAEVVAETASDIPAEADPDCQIYYPAAQAQ